MNRAARIFALAALVAAGCEAPAPRSPTPSTPPPNDLTELPIAWVPFEPGPLPAVAPLPLDRPRVEIGPVSPEVEARTTARVIDGPILGRDPQIAVGERFLVVHDARRYELVDKASGKRAGARAGDEIAPSGDFGQLFSPLWSSRDKQGRPNAESVNRKLAPHCDPDAPEASPACLRDFADARVIWDARRRRFWVTAGIADRLAGEQGRRLIALAVSRTDDPRDGFHRFALLPDGANAGRPKIALADRYLILGPASSSVVHVFDADLLSAGDPGRAPVEVSRFDVGQYQLRRFEPVDHHGDSGGVAYLLGSDGVDRVKVLGLVNRDPNHAARPDVVPGRWIKVSRRLDPLQRNPVWRSGLLTAAWDECANVAADPCDTIRVLHVLRLPAQLDGPGASVEVKRLRAAGYLDFAFGIRDLDDAAQDKVDYLRPALDVNDHGDLVIAYARRGAETATELDPEVRYSILYHGESRPRPGVLVRKGSWFDVPDLAGEGGIDLAGAAIDPSDDHTIWITHAYADKDVRAYRQVIAAVRP